MPRSIPYEGLKISLTTAPSGDTNVVVEFLDGDGSALVRMNEVLVSRDGGSFVLEPVRGELLLRDPESPEEIQRIAEDLQSKGSNIVVQPPDDPLATQ